LIAVTFATLVAFVGLSIPDAFKGIGFEDDSALASALLFELFHPDIDISFPSTRWREVFAISKASLANSIRQRFWPGS
jgi:hypothetical protein